MRILCLESGGTKLVAAEANQEGRLVNRTIALRRPGQTADETLRQMISMGHRLLQGHPPDAVAFGFGGTVSRSTQRPVYCFHENGWEEIDGYQILVEAFQSPVFIENDCTVAAFAEARCGFGVANETLVYVTVGTGIGAGIVYRGEPFRSGEVGEGEVGHILVEPEGPPCACGQRGCLETLCSGPGLAELCRREFQLAWDAPTLMERFRSQDSKATAIAERAAGYMAAALAPAVNLLAPDLIVLGGGVMENNQSYLDLIRQKTYQLAFPPIIEKAPPRFHLSRLAKDVVCQGAALLALLRMGRLEPSQDILYSHDSPSPDLEEE